MGTNTSTLTRLNPMKPDCEKCAELEIELAILKVENARLLRAVHREAEIIYDIRAPHDGRAHIDRHDKGFIDRSRERRRK